MGTASWLRGRSLEQAEASHNQPHLLDAPAPFAGLAAQASALSRIRRRKARVGA